MPAASHNSPEVSDRHARHAGLLAVSGLVLGVISTLISLVGAVYPYLVKISPVLDRTFPGLLTGTACGNVLLWVYLVYVLRKIRKNRRSGSE